MQRPDDIVVADGGDTHDLDGDDPDGENARPDIIWIHGLLRHVWPWGCPMPMPPSCAIPDQRVLPGDRRRVSVGFNFMEFETALRKGLPIVVVISAMIWAGA